MSQLILPFSLDKRIRVQHLALPEMLLDVPEARLHEEKEPGKWTAFDNAAHLAAFHEVFTHRINRMLTETAPVFEPYIWKDDTLFEQFRTMPKEPLLQRFEHDRNVFLTLVDSISAEEMQRTGVHQIYGEFTIAQWLEFFVLHESHHLFTIYKLIHLIRK